MKYSNSIYRKIAIMLFALTVSLTLFSSCKKKNDIPPASYENAAYFLVPRIESTSNLDPLIYHFIKNYSFYFLGDPTIVKDTIWLPQVRIVGNVADHDRVINIKVIDSGTTAIAGKNYKLLNYVVPAGSFVANKLGVEVYRTADLGDNTLKLMLKLEPNADFPGLMIGNSLSYDAKYYTGDTYKINISNKLIEPPYWAPFIIHFNAFSTVKYQFMVDVLHVYIGTNPDTSIDLGNITIYKTRLNNALDEYNNNHPNNHLTDENGNEISF
ncbi:DUF4843 domain-containing protein [Pedobacter paludis]|uniref:DUF4843 domain-containing protein n=1 Tax=Pedobacter paludis TaxID=2203212 RepID=A0A317EXP2_9SPHI|nr:DUF4843 domain-containing protein [Pedobacter paludis]PWS30509.1 hypothetical protein DF947_16350 [Pedobacter paludis]